MRLLEWNVSDSAWVKSREASRAMLRHMDPDVLVLVQVAPGIGGAGVRSMLAGLRTPADTTWFVSVRGGSDYEQTIIASRDSLRELPEFGTVTYRTDNSLSSRAAVPDSGAPVPPRDRVNSVHTNGVLALVGARWVLVAAVHLTCCGSAHSWREYRRQLGALEIRDRVRSAALRTRPAGIVLSGDMNLVTGRAALDTLLGTLSGSQVGPLTRVDAYQSDGWSAWTWDSRGTPFNGGVLDNVLFSPGSMRVVRSLVWDTESMSPDTLSAHHLTPDAARSINRHRPVVVDFELAPAP